MARQSHRDRSRNPRGIGNFQIYQRRNVHRLSESSSEIDVDNPIFDWNLFFFLMNKIFETRIKSRIFEPKLKIEVRDQK